MNPRITFLLVALLVLLNLGGVVGVVLGWGRGDASGLSTLAWLVAMDAAGFWLLRQVRD